MEMKMEVLAIEQHFIHHPLCDTALQQNDVSPIELLFLQYSSFHHYYLNYSIKLHV